MFVDHRDCSGTFGEARPVLPGSRSVDELHQDHALSFKVFPQWVIFHGWLGEVDRQLRFDGLWVGREG